MEKLDPLVLLGALAALCVLAVPVLTVWRAIFGGFAKKSELSALETKVNGMDAVTRKEYEHHNDSIRTATGMRDVTVNRVLDIHEENISDAHKRVDDVLKDMNKGFSDLKDILLERLPKK